MVEVDCMVCKGGGADLSSGIVCPFCHGLGKVQKRVVPSRSDVGAFHRGARVTQNAKPKDTDK